MAVSGAKWVCSDEDIISALKSSGGRVSYASKALGVVRNTLYNRINEKPYLKELLSEMRHDFEETMLDAAENTLMYALAQQKGDLGNALKSAFYTLNNRGEKRGYSVKNNPNNSNAGISLSDIKTIAQYVGSSKKVSRAGKS